MKTFLYAVRDKNGRYLSLAGWDGESTLGFAWTPRTERAKFWVARSQAQWVADRTGGSVYEVQMENLER